MPAPVNLLIYSPSTPTSNWQEEADQWISLNREARGNPDFRPLTVKAAYVIGVIHDLCTCVDYLLRAQDSRQTTYLSAYGIFASSMDIFGRCILGNSSTSGTTNDLKAGLKWLASSSYQTIPDDHVLVTTTSHPYTINELVYIRHFTVHGQATSRLQWAEVDYELLSRLLPLLANGLDRYWRHLLVDEKACNRLAEASILALRSHPVMKSWILFEKDQSGKYHSVEEIFDRFNWTI